MAIVEKGTKVNLPDLRDQYGEKLELSKENGKLLFAFHPLAFTSVCTDQMRDLELNYDRFVEKGVKPYGVSVDAHPSKAVWATAIGVKKTPLLADFNPKGALAEEFGIYVDKAGISSRAVVIVEDGVVVWSKEYEKPQRPDVEEIFEVIDKL